MEKDTTNDKTKNRTASGKKENTELIGDDDKEPKTKAKARSWRRNRADEESNIVGEELDAKSNDKESRVDEPDKLSGLPRRNNESKPLTGDAADNDIEQNRHQDYDQQHTQGPVRILQPLRTDPIASFQTRQKRLDRLSADELPEIHFIGQISSAEGMLMDENEGILVRWSIDIPSSWQHLGGEMLGQTQVSYCRTGLGAVLEKTSVPLNHPIDVHFAFYGLQGWGASRIAIQCFRMDIHGRRILSGYGFVHLPCIPGFHKLEIQCWRPLGSPEQEAAAFFVGTMPALVSEKVIYESAWADRCRLITASAGKVYLELYAIGRFLNRHSIDT